jgi:hypothetical protein
LGAPIRIGLTRVHKHLQCCGLPTPDAAATERALRLVADQDPERVRNGSAASVTGQNLARSQRRSSVAARCGLRAVCDANAALTSVDPAARSRNDGSNCSVIRAVGGPHSDCNTISARATYRQGPVVMADQGCAWTFAQHAAGQAEALKDADGSSTPQHAGFTGQGQRTH